MDYRVLTEAERKYTFSQSQQLSMQTGLIGYLRADFGSTGKEFYSTWNDFRKDLKTDDFKKEFDLVINSYRFGDGKTMERTCRYIDDYHLEVGTNLYHICEFAELCERNGHTVEPASKENTKPAKDKEKSR